MKKLSVFLAIFLALTTLASCTPAGVDEETTPVQAGQTGRTKNTAIEIMILTLPRQTIIPASEFSWRQKGMTIP
ncbi:MAG TPA: hypothetical protein GX011_02835 [Clostridiales bacterium]|jgi:hypothetical protein|nr:hypothetical protein [Clostridiales bacterium]